MNKNAMTHDRRPQTSDRKIKYKSLVTGLWSLVLIFMIGVGVVYGREMSPQVAGNFYPADKKELSKTIDSYLSQYPFIENNGDLLALISPHAGYEYSGIVAAYGYKQLTKRKYDTVIIIGPSHYAYFDGISVCPSGEYKTPLGKVEIDQALAEKLLEYNEKIGYDANAHLKEHCVEVQIPFLQKTLKNFKIVPVIIGNQSLENCMILSKAILESIKDKKVLIVASTDLSHYLSYEAANAMDGKVVSAFSRGDLNLMIEMLATGEVQMCGYGPVITAMYVGQLIGGNSYEVLKYLNSGDTTTNMDKVVGYMSAAIYRRTVVLDSIQRSRLLQIARETLESYLSGEATLPEYEIYEKDLQTRSGVFVTLKKGDKLRGCVGYIYPVKPLYLAAQEMVINAAANDKRFDPVTKDELEDIKIEISVLSPLTRINDPSEVKVGKHGLYILKGGSSGLLLPQVATENKWTREEFLDNVCYKAGLEPSAWKDKDAVLYIFEADVFHEY